MPIRLRAKSDRSNITGEQTDPRTVETTVDGMTFAWGPGEKRAFADDGVGNAHALFEAGRGANVFVDNSLASVVPVTNAPARS